MFTDNQFKIYNYTNSFQIDVGIAVITRLGIPDILLSNPKTTEELAKQVKVDAKRLSRLLKALVAEKILSLDKNGKFTLNDVSKLLTQKEPGSLYSSMHWYGDCGFQAWLKLYDSVAHNQCAFEVAFEQPFFEYLKKHEETAKNFNDSQSQLTEAIISKIVGKFPFADFNTIVDVGGGNGKLITRILSAYPSVNGILFDMSEVINNQDTQLMTKSLAQRLNLVGGSFFDYVPPSGDLYLLKYILHDWPDSEALRILQNCRKAMSVNSRLIIIELLVSEEPEETFSKWRDLEMMVLFDSKERTKSEFSELLQNAQLKLTRTISLDGLVHIIETQSI